MSNDEGENLDFNEFDATGDDMLQPTDDMLQPAEEMLQPAEEMLEPGDELFQPAEVEPADDVLQPESLAETAAFDDLAPALVSDAGDETKDDTETEPEKAKRFGLPDYLAWALVVVSCAGLIAVDVWIYRKYGGESHLFLGFVSALWLTLTAIPLLLILGRRKVTIFDYVLALTLTGIVVGIFCLLMELVSYGGDITAEEAKQRVMAPAVQSAPARTTAAT